jgi:hypothetical protein
MDPNLGRPSVTNLCALHRRVTSMQYIIITILLLNNLTDFASKSDSGGEAAAILTNTY